MNVRKTPKGYYYDTKTNLRISAKEAMRREKISESLKKYYEAKRISERIENILNRIYQRYEIEEYEKQIWYHE